MCISGGGSIGESSESGSQEASAGAVVGGEVCEAGEGLRTSKSDTSLSDSFVMLSAPPSPSPKPARPPNTATSAGMYNNAVLTYLNVTDY